MDRPEVAGSPYLAAEESWSGSEPSQLQPEPHEGGSDFALGESYARADEEMDWQVDLEEPPPPRKKRWLGPVIAVAIVLPVAAALYWLSGAPGGWSLPSTPIVDNPPREAPTPEPTPLERGWVLVANDAAIEAIVVFQQLIHDNPDDAAAHHGLGRAAFEADKTELAIHHLEEAARLDTTSVQFAVDLAYGQLSVNRPEAALASARRALELAPDEPTAHMVAGRALVESGQAAEAVPSLTAYVEANPDDLSARPNLARALAAAGRTESAITEATLYLDSSPDDPALQAARLDWMQSVGQTAEAARTYAALARKHPQDPHYLYLAGLANPGEDGVGYLEKAVALLPDHGDAWATLGRYQTSLGRHRSAVRAFAAAFEQRAGSNEERALFEKAQKAMREPGVDTDQLAEEKSAAENRKELESRIEVIRSALAGENIPRARKALEMGRRDLKGAAARRNFALWEGIIAFESSEFQNARRQFQSLPLDASFRESGYGVGAVRNWIARTHLAEANPRSAITVFDRVGTKSANEYAFARLWEGIALSSLGMEDLAKRTWRRVAEDVASRVGPTGEVAMRSASFLAGDLSEREYRAKTTSLGGSFENDMQFVLGFAASTLGEPDRARTHFMSAMNSSAGREFPYHLAREQVEGGGFVRGIK
jgi:tetratricopeptide (TPR) repeat protein